MKCIAALLAMILWTGSVLAASPLIQESAGCIKTSWLFSERVQTRFETVIYQFLLDVRNSCGVAGQVHVRVVGTDALDHEVDSFVMTSRLGPWQSMTMTDKVPLPAEKDLFINRWDIQSVNFLYDTIGQL